MTLPRSETPLRRSAVASHRESMLREKTMINDDEAERREARRRTMLLEQSRPRETNALESLEENETIRNCLEIYNGNKLSRDNAWTMSIIDTLSNLLERHHKTMSNFKMAGSSLEAVSKVYGLRVDSIYLDAMRLAAGLNARTLTEQQLNAAVDRDDNGADTAEGSAVAAGNDDPAPSSAPKVKKRKAVATVTKNKDTLNARLDTVPLQDPVFGKLNSTVGSINASNRLMHNILPTVDSELKIRTNYCFWNSDKLPDEVTDYTKVENEVKSTEKLVNAEWIKKLQRYEQLKLRPLHSGYIISDVPNLNNPNETIQQLRDDNDIGVDNTENLYENPQELSMAFDINAECEPMPDLDAPAPAVLEVDDNDMDELTTDERTTLQMCRLLRKQPVIIEDLRPIDGNSKLEYSYRPMDNITRFWAGPSHWKFRRTRPRSTFSQVNLQDNIDAGGSNSTSATKGRERRATQKIAKRESNKLEFGVCTESLFIPLDSNTKLRKVNHQRWDERKLLLPTKYDFEPEYFYKYEFAPQRKVSKRFGVLDDIDDDQDADVAPDGAADDVELYDNEHFTVDTPISTSAMYVSSIPTDVEPGTSQLDGSLTTCGIHNDTILEISTNFEGAPTQVTKVIVPFAKRAKVIDMKNLKRSCSSLIQKQLLNTVPEDQIPKHPNAKNENYAKGMATFKQVYEELPSLLTAKMNDSLSPSVALYAVLHLANDMKLRLTPQDDLKGFTIRQVTD